MLPFLCESLKEVDLTYEKLIKLGGIPIASPKNMPWNQRTVLFADPDGNIHEIFAEIS